RDVAPELERVVLHQPEDHRPGLHIAARVEEAGGDGAFERRADGGALELDAELVAPRPRHLERRPHLLVLLGRDDAVAVQRTAPALVGDGLLEARLGPPPPRRGLLRALEATEIHPDHPAGVELGAVLGPVLQDGGARETEQEGRGEAPQRPACQAVAHEHALDRLPHALPALARRALVALLVALHERQEVRPPPEEAEEAEHHLLEHGVGRRVGRGRPLDATPATGTPRCEGTWSRSTWTPSTAIRKAATPTSATAYPTTSQSAARSRASRATTR